MKKLIFCATSLALALIISMQAFAVPSSVIFPQGTTAIKMLEFGKLKLVVTGNAVLEYRGKKLRSVYEDADGIKDAILKEHTLFLATRKGLKRLNVDANYTAEQTQFPNQEISCLALDNLNRLWVGSLFHGVYLQRSSDSFELKIEIPSILSIASSADTNVWVGTNVGLYRVGTGYFSTTRYAEEGYAGYELPDNVVEHLFADELTNLWVVMPDNISFKKGAGFQSEMPTFDFLGDKGNTIKSIIAVRKTWYFFVTANGLSYMPIHALQNEQQHATEEVHEAHNMQARQASNKQLHCPEGWENEHLTRSQKLGNNVWFFTAKGCWCVSEKKLNTYLKN